jgi:hypothetical protein
MYTTLEVVNGCLASMGEAPLSSIVEPHAMKGSALAELNRANRTVQSKGRWFNTEDVTLKPDSVNGWITLAGDCLKFQSGSSTSIAKPYLVQRGSRLYDLRNRAYVLTEDVSGVMVRLVPCEELPPVAADYVGTMAVLRFQSNFDADNSKRQELTQDNVRAKIEFMAEDIRQRKVNLLDSNRSIARIRQHNTNTLRY